jgi:hypothetical protein
VGIRPSGAIKLRGDEHVERQRGTATSGPAPTASKLIIVAALIIRDDRLGDAPRGCG